MNGARFGISDAKWRSLCGRIAAGDCVPIVGARMREDTPLPLPNEIPHEWASDADYPLSTGELAMVAEWVRLQMLDKRALLKNFCEFFDEYEARLPDDWGTNHPLRTLAELPFTTYITTSFDDLLAQALLKYRGKQPVEVSCQWHPEDRYWDPQDENLSKVTPSFDQPVIFYLHGRCKDPMSLVLTETDHMTFTAALSRDSQQSKKKNSLLPAPIRLALARGSWLFIGYGAADRNLRGLLRALTGQVHHTQQAIAIHLQKGDARPGMEDAADEFLTSYFKGLLGGDVEVLLNDDVGDFLAAIKAELP